MKGVIVKKAVRSFTGQVGLETLSIVIPEMNNLTISSGVIGVIGNIDAYYGRGFKESEVVKRNVIVPNELIVAAEKAIHSNKNLKSMASLLKELLA